MPSNRESLLTKYFYETGFGAMFALAPTCMNYYARRPWYSGIQRHIALGIVGVIVGHYANRLLEAKWSERDAIIKHYIELHPEDFVDNRKKYKEIFEEWYPVR